MHMDVLHRHLLLALAAIAIERVKQHRIGAGELVCLAQIVAPALERLFGGVYKDSNGKYYLWEKVVAADVNGVLGWKWEQYDDFTDPIRLPRYMADMDTGYLRILACSHGGAGSG
jgi:hypothetical protein